VQVGVLVPNSQTKSDGRSARESIANCVPVLATKPSRTLEVSNKIRPNELRPLDGDLKNTFQEYCQIKAVNLGVGITYLIPVNQLDSVSDLATCWKHLILKGKS